MTKLERRRAFPAFSFVDFNVYIMKVERMFVPTQSLPNVFENSKLFTEKNCGRKNEAVREDIS